MSQILQGVPVKGFLPEQHALLPRPPGSFGHGKDESRVIVGVPKESYPGERRVALVPVVIPNLAKAGLEVVVEAGPASRLAIPTPPTSKRARRFCPTAPPCSAPPTLLCRCSATGRMTLPVKTTFR